MNRQSFTELAPSIPLEPGIYKYFDEKDQLIYVGKARQLRKRVSSYFTVRHDNQKTIELVKRIHRIEFTIVENEADALFLEDSLIKKYKPHYNINLKDDKTYPYVVIKNEAFPRVFITRRKIQDGSRYFGPYTSAANVNEILAFIKQYFPLRSCTLNLSEQQLRRNSYKVCLEYHLGNCKGPCEKLQSAENYAEGIDRLIEMLKGNTKPLIMHLRQQIETCVSKLEFEQAASLQFKLKNLLEYKAKSTVVNTKTGNVDVFSISETGSLAYVNYLAVNDGAIVHTKTITLEKKMSEDKSELLCFAITHLRKLYSSVASELILPFQIEYPDSNLKIIIPKAGDKKKLLDLSEKNVSYFKQEQERKSRLQKNMPQEEDPLEVLKSVQEKLHLKEIPEHIECFDNSNLQGTNPVAAMVCFKDGIASKKDFRHFNIKTVAGIDDFASMKEIVFRRYKRLSEDGQPLPSLVIIDGGKGQLNAAYEAICELGLQGRFTLVGLAKNIEELFFLGDQRSIKLEWNSAEMKLIRRIRDEVHRFGITFHRNQRSRTAIDTQLEKIPGIGSTTAELLLKRFRSVGNIKKRSFDELADVIGTHKARVVFGALHQ